jgi:hypothetical protein
MPNPRLIIAFLLCLAQGCAFAAPIPAWPARVFAPYMYLGQDDGFKLTDCDDACGVKFYTLAFIIAGERGRGTNAVFGRQPTWYGRIPMEQDLYHDQIDAIRQRGGDVIVSFGGEDGRELAMVMEDPVALQAAYQSIIDRYHFTWLDFDIEGDNLEKAKNFPATHRRNTALAALQSKNPGLIISYTLPVNPDGLTAASQALLTDAKAQGVKVHSANIMVMFFGRKFIHHGKVEGELGIDSANSAYAQLQKIDPAILVGLCPCLGNNGSSAEVFTLADAKTLKAFADKTPWVCSLHFWSINDDAARPRRHRNTSATTNTNSPPATDAPKPWAFANIFKSFTSDR